MGDGIAGNGNVVPPGDNTQHNTLGDEEKPRMADDDKTILIVGVAVFVLFCVSAIAYFGYKWRKGKRVERNKGVRVGLTDETEEHKFTGKDGKLSLVDQDEVEVQI